MPAIEGSKAFADARPATDSLRHQGQPVDGAGHVTVAQGRRHMGKAGVKHEGFGLPEGIDDAVEEAHEKRGVEAHRAGGVEQYDEPQRLDLASSPSEIDRRAAMGDAAVNGAPQVDAPSAL